MTRALAFAAGAYAGWRVLRVPHPLKGKVVFITGGSRGLGLLIAREVAKRGGLLVVCARNANEVDAARAELAGMTDVLARVCDMTDIASVQDLVQEAYSRFGGIDVLVNNAGIIQVGPAENMSLVDFHDAMDSIFWSAAHATLAILPSMRRRRSGAIVNITSIDAVLPVPHMLPYTAAKWALAGFSFGLREEEGRNGIRVTTIAPGLMRTGSFVHAQVKGDKEAEANKFTLQSTLPLLTMSGEHAARRIVRAIERGESFVVLGAKFKLARLAFALAPRLFLAGGAIMNRALPKPRGSPLEKPEPVWKHRSGIAASPLTALGDRAARRNNETISIGDDLPAP